MQDLNNVLGWAALRRKAIRKRVWRVLNIVVAVVTIANVSAIGVAIAPQPVTAAFGSGAIWTTNESCANPAAQDDNEYAIGETVHVRGENFDPNVTLYYEVKGQPGGASADPATIVASGSTTTDGTGYFCVAAYTVASDDDGTYTVDVDETADIQPPLKNDNYRVNGTLFGSITVSKAIDTDGDGSFEGGDSEGNAAGFRWGVNADPADREFGTTLLDVAADDYEITENSQNGYHVTGWFYTNGDGSCENPDGETLPASISVSSNEDKLLRFVTPGMSIR